MAEVLEKERVVKAPAEPLFSKKNRRLMSNPLDSDNPITVQVLGVCSALAVTVQLKPTLVMALAVLFVVASFLYVGYCKDSRKGLPLHPLCLPYTNQSLPFAN